MQTVSGLVRPLGPVRSRSVADVGGERGSPRCRLTSLSGTPKCQSMRREILTSAVRGRCAPRAVNREARQSETSIPKAATRYLYRSARNMAQPMSAVSKNNV